MKQLIRLEELLMLALGMVLFTWLDYAWWVFAALIFIPDVSMLGYAINEKAGACIYNIFHHKGVALMLYFLGLFLESDIITLIGVMLFSHASMDRIFGYGVKFADSFQHTHLGWIGKRKEN
ncbi:MAG: DUF4260 domain-containing protein [Balneolaceae bacterium]|nr:DUF4260 domain-containing protein [Balneolaceae bacterium]